MLLTAEDDVTLCYEHGVCIENEYARNFKCRWSPRVFFTSKFGKNTSTHSMCVSQTLEFRVLRKISEAKRDEVVGIEGAVSWGTSWPVLTLYYLCHIIENNEMGVTCSTLGETRFWWENTRERDNLKDRSINGRMMLKWIWNSGMENVHCVAVAQGRENWLAFVSTVINFGVAQSAGNF